MHDKLIKEVEATVSPVYLVGGSVRDILLKREPKDYDFCTPLSPDEIEAKVKEAGRRAYATGKRFGTIGFKCAGEFIEVTTFRTERYNSGSRKPEVEFVNDLRLDLSRRDFTINAIALKDGEYFDPYGGRLDILAKKIKAVGEATDRFKEDPLRMLRAARFASQLDFEIDPNMVGKIRKMSHMITEISRERWVQELDKLLLAEHYNKGLAFLADSHLLPFMIPELMAHVKDPILGTETLCNVGHAPLDADLRWAALLMTIGKPYAAKEGKFGKITHPQHDKIGLELARGIALRLKFSNKRIEIIEQVLKTQQIK